jgi:hypothetical protein
LVSSLADARLQAIRSLAKPDGSATATFDCDAGCDLKKNKVCGDDGFTYYNECLAYCQVRTSFKEHYLKLK